MTPGYYVRRRGRYIAGPMLTVEVADLVAARRGGEVVVIRREAVYVIPA